MKCETIMEDLQAFLDDELQDARRSEIEAHLNECKDCAKVVADLRDVTELLQGWNAPEPKLPTGRQLLAQARPPQGPLVRLLRSFYELPFKVKMPIFTTAALVIIGLVLTNQLGLKQASYAPELGTVTTSRRSYPVESPISTNQPVASNYRPSSPAAQNEADVKEREIKQAAGGRAGNEEGVASGVIGGMAAPAAPQKAAKVAAGESLSKDEAVANARSDKAEELPKETVAPGSPEARERLIIKSAQLDIDTENFDEAKNRTTELAAENGGFITRLQVSTQGNLRAAQVVIRVPSRNFEKVISELRKFGKSTQESIEGQDVTDQYLEVTDEIEIEKGIEKDAKALAGSNPSNLAVKREHEESLRRLSSFRRQLQQMRDGVYLSTITLNLRERNGNEIIGSNEGPSVGQQILTAFRNGVKNFFLLLLPIILFIGEEGISILFCAALIYLIYRLGRRYLRKHSAFKVPPTEMPDWMRTSNSGQQ